MSGTKETPRQKMIGMMYLFYTALLALNISADILNAFVLVNDNMKQTNVNFESKNQMIMAAFAKQMGVQKEKVEPYYIKAQKATKLSKELVEYLNEVQSKLIIATEGLEPKIPATDTEIAHGFEYIYEAVDGSDSVVVYENAYEIPARVIKKKDNYNAPMEVLMSEMPGVTPEVDIMKEKFADFNSQMMALLQDHPEQQAKIKLGLNTSRVRNVSEMKWESWEHNSFHHTVLVADLVLMNKYISEVLNTETEVLAQLFSNIEEKTIKFDAVRAAVIPKSNYVIRGNDYEAEIFVAAYNKKGKPVVNIKTNADTLTVADQKGEGIVKIDSSSNGIVKYVAATSSTGEFSYAGYINVRGADGSFEPHFFSQSYQVIEPTATVSPTKMNVVYVGLNNPMSFSASGFSMSELSVRASGGTIKNKKGDGTFVFVPTIGKQKAKIVISGTKPGGESKNLGSFEFRIKGVPPATPEINGKKNLQSISASSVGNVARLNVLLKNFPFDLTFKVVKFNYRLQGPRGRVFASGNANSAMLPKKLITGMKKAPRGSLLKVMSIYYVDVKRPSMRPKLASNLAINIQ